MNTSLYQVTQKPTGKGFLHRDLYEAAIIDDEGREIPITAEMIDQALQKLSQEAPKKQWACCA